MRRYFVSLSEKKWFCYTVFFWLLGFSMKCNVMQCGGLVPHLFSFNRGAQEITLTVVLFGWIQCSPITDNLRVLTTNCRKWVCFRLDGQMWAGNSGGTSFHLAKSKGIECTWTLATSTHKLINALLTEGNIFPLHETLPLDFP